MNYNSINVIDLSKQIHKRLLNNKKNYEIKSTGSIQPSGSIQKKIRNPGVDLIRMIAMNGIIINHLIYQGKGFLKFAKYERQLVLLNSFFFCIIMDLLYYQAMLGIKLINILIYYIYG